MNVYQPELSKQHETAVAVRQRLFRSPSQELAKRAVDSDAKLTALRDKYDVEIDALNKRLKLVTMWAKAELDREKQERHDEVSKLELDLADARARLLTQAEMLKSLDDENSPADQRRPVKVIVAEVLERYPDVTWDDVKGVRRTRDLIEPRHACMKAVYDERKDLSLPRLGRLFARDHTTILSAVRK
jgi:chromosomal replication initiator protein